MQASSQLDMAGFDGIAVKPAQQPIESVDVSAVDTVVVDFEGHDHLPQPGRLAPLAETTSVVLTTPIRADGFDPIGDDHRLADYATIADFAVVAGNGSYLLPHERRRSIAPRLAAALTAYPDSWVGTEGIERLALATGAIQYELLSARTLSAVRGLRAAGFDGELAVYAPTTITDDRDGALAVLEPYLRRRRPVRQALDAMGSGSNEEAILDAALDDYAIVGDTERVRERIQSLKAAGVTSVIGYPASPQ